MIRQTQHNLQVHMTINVDSIDLFLLQIDVFFTHGSPDTDICIGELYTCLNKLSNVII